MKYPVLNPAIFFLLALGLNFSCGKGPAGNEGSSDTLASTVQESLRQPPFKENPIFEGEYQIGDGTWLMSPAEGGVCMKASPEAEPVLLLEKTSPTDSIRIFETKDKTIRLLMKPDLRSGWYEEPDEKWPVLWVKPLPKEETEEEEIERLRKQQAKDESSAFAEMHQYSGNYQLSTESHGVQAGLTLKYRGDKTFSFSWSFKVQEEEASCSAQKTGIIQMDRTQHGFFKDGDCLVHVNLNGFWNGKYAIEWLIENPEKCPDLQGPCDFSGTYLK